MLLSECIEKYFCDKRVALNIYGHGHYICAYYKFSFKEGVGNKFCRLCERINFMIEKCPCSGFFW